MLLLLRACELAESLVELLLGRKLALPRLGDQLLRSVGCLKSSTISAILPLKPAEDELKENEALALELLVSAFSAFLTSSSAELTCFSSAAAARAMIFSIFLTSRSLRKPLDVTEEDEGREDEEVELFIA